MKNNIKKFLLGLLCICYYGSLWAQNEQIKHSYAPELTDSSSYTWIVLPDPQTYSKFGRNQAHFTTMIDWIIDQKEKLNIQMVYCVGDLVEQNNILYPDSINGDQSSHSQWQFISNAFYKLNNKLPYILCTGNHDYGIKSAENRYSQFNSYFPPNLNPLNHELLVEMFPNSEGVETLENAVYKWKSPQGKEHLIFSLEFAPRIEVLTWADSIANLDRYKDYIGVLLTHSYLDSDGTRTHLENYPLENANYGKVIWEEFISKSSQMQFVFSGHIGNSDEHQDQVGYRLDRNSKGLPINQMLFNAQREGGGWHGNGGNGWLRILEFIPSKRTVKVKTFSPLFYNIPELRDKSWRTEAYDEFEMKY